MNDVTDKSHQDQVRYFRQMYSLYQQNKDLITIGAYQRGSDARLDEAVSAWPRMVKFLQQAYDESERFDSSLDQLSVLLED